MNGTSLPKGFLLLNLELTENEYKLFFAAFRNDYRTIGALQSVGINYNVRDKEGRTALMVAAAEGNLESV